jgi:hypothetical protein
VTKLKLPDLSEFHLSIYDQRSPKLFICALTGSFPCSLLTQHKAKTRLATQEANWPACSARSHKGRVLSQTKGVGGEKWLSAAPEFTTTRTKGTKIYDPRVKSEDDTIAQQK